MIPERVERVVWVVACIASGTMAGTLTGILAAVLWTWGVGPLWALAVGALGGAALGAPLGALAGWGTTPESVAERAALLFQSPHPPRAVIRVGAIAGLVEGALVGAVYGHLVGALAGAYLGLGVGGLSATWAWTIRRHVPLFVLRLLLAAAGEAGACLLLGLCLWFLALGQGIMLMATAAAGALLATVIVMRFIFRKAARAEGPKGDCD